jgi:hypothetical protein
MTARDLENAHGAGLHAEPVAECLECLRRRDEATVATSRRSMALGGDAIYLPVRLIWIEAFPAEPEYIDALDDGVDIWVSAVMLASMRQSWRDFIGVAVPIVDRAIIARANVLGWSEHRLFEWLNSRDGRHFADAAAIQLRRHSPTEHGSGGRPVTEDGSQRAARPPCHRLLVALVVIGPDLGQFELRGLASLQRVLDLLILDDLLVEAQLLLFLDRHYLLSAHKELFPIPDAPRRLSAAERKVDEREKLKREWKPA